MNDTLDVTTIVFAVLAIFVLFKLRSVLGTRTGSERPPGGLFSRSRDAGPDQDGKVVRLPGSPRDGTGPASADPKERWGEAADEAAWPGLEEIYAADKSFDAKSFLEGARGAYEMIVAAFAGGDRATLRNLLSPEVFDSFSGAIASREARGEKVETTLVSIDKTSIPDAHLRDQTAQVTVRFVTKLITVTRNAAGEVVDGSPERVLDVVDVWTFARVAGARDPNWKLVATESAH